MRSFLMSLIVFFSGVYVLDAAEPRLIVSRPEALVDRAVHIQLAPLKPDEKIWIVTQTTDDSGLRWYASGLFQANSTGRIDLGVQSPLMGSYEGVDPMGLFWSMQPSESNAHAPFKIKGESFSVAMVAYRGKKEIARTDIIRLRQGKDITKKAVRENGLNAIWFSPDSQKTLPCIIVLSGSNGGYGENRAQLLASHGFHVLALAYFGVEGLPSHLQEIPLEYFERAFEWIKKQPRVDKEHIGIYGVSRGAELALILGSWFPDAVQAIVAVAPSCVVHAGLSDKPVHAWTHRGRPILPFAYVPRMVFNGEVGQDREHLAAIMPSFLQGMKDVTTFEAALIPVEKIKASLLLVSGGDDQMWPSALYAQKIVQRLSDNQSAIFYQHLYYPNAGHGINIPHLPQMGPAYYHPVGKLWMSMGGTAAQDQYASKDSWKKMIDFFHTQLHPNNLKNCLDK